MREAAFAVYAAIFALLAVRALIDWRRRHDASSLWFSTAFGVLAIAVTGSMLARIAWQDEPPRVVNALLVALLAGYSPSLLWFSAAFAKIGRRELYAVSAVFAVLAAWALIGLDMPGPGESGSTAFMVYSGVFVAAWIGVSLRVIGSLWLASRNRPGIVRGRMRLLAVGFGLLDVALLVQSLDSDNQLSALIAVISAVAAIATLLGFVPPDWLRIVLRQPEQQLLRQAIGEVATAPTERAVLEALLPAVRNLLGVERVALVPHAGSDLLADGYDEEQLATIRRATRRLEADGATGTNVSGGRIHTRGAASWIVLDRPTGGAFFGDDELDVIESMDAVVRMSLGRIRDAAAVREHEQQLQTAVDIAELGKWNWTVGGDHVWWSPRMYDIFQVDRGEPLTYDRYIGMLHPDDRERVAEVVATALERREPYELDHRIQRPDGSEAWVHSRARVVVDDDGTPQRITGITLDVTDRVRAEQELRSEIEVEREAARRLRALDELKTNILSAVSHELRTPLTAVHGFAILLQDRMEELEPERRGQIVDHLVVEAERLAQLFADLLDIDRLRRGAIDAQRAPVNVRELVVGLVHERERREQILLDLQVEEFELDAPKVARIVENLVVNAEKYAGHDSQIRIGASVDDDGLELRVEDDGPGVPEHLREVIFEPFHRGDADLGHAPGTGIGLSLVRQFARLHGGRAWVEPSASGGASFVVRIPAAPVTDAVPTSAA